MNQKAAYEMTITEKLEQLTVPDMVDAIWARIETRLDIDMPPDDGPPNPPANPPAGTGTWTRVIITIFVAALVTTIYFTNRKTNINNNTPAQRENATIISSPGNTNDKPPPAQDISSPQPSPRLNDNAVSTLQPAADSLVNRAVIDSAVLPGADSSFIAPVTVPAPPISSADTSKKKNRGVKSIKDSDYRITPAKQDSSN